MSPENVERGRRLRLARKMLVGSGEAAGAPLSATNVPKTPAERLWLSQTC
jgi:hypothetical protein